MQTSHLGHIQRLTYPKSHSKQGYHDARKAQWGDLFPFAPKGKEVVRTRGVRRLTKIVPEEGGEGLMDELLGRQTSGPQDKGTKGKKRRASRGMRSDDEAILVEGEMEEGRGVAEADGEETIVWRSGNGEKEAMDYSQNGQRREMSTIAHTRRRLPCW